MARTGRAAPVREASAHPAGAAMRES